MDILETVLLILLVLVALAMGVLVLLQQSKGADIGAAFGSGSSNTIFGAAGATSFLVKFTAMLAIGYFVIAFGLSYTAKERAASLRGYDFQETMEASPADSSTAADAQEVVEGELEGDDMPEFVIPDVGVEEPDSANAESNETGQEQDLPDL